MVSFTRFEFLFDFFFFMFLSSSYYSMWLCRRTTIILFVSICVSDSHDRVVSIRQRNHIKSLFVSMFHQIYNLRYFKHYRITNYVNLKPFILTVYTLMFLVVWFLCSDVMYCSSESMKKKRVKNFKGMLGSYFLKLFFENIY